MKMKDKKILSFVCAFMLLFTTLFSDLCLISSGVYAAVAEDGTVAINADVDSEESTTEELYFEEAQEEFVEDTTAPEFTIDYSEEETSDSVKVIISISEDTDDVDTVVVTNLEEEEIEVTSNNDGTYSFIASENDTYVVTVSDFSGNSADKEVIIDNIISEETEEVVTEEQASNKVTEEDAKEEDTERQLVLMSSDDGIMLTSTFEVIENATYYHLPDTNEDYGILALKIKIGDTYYQCFCVEHGKHLAPDTYTTDGINASSYGTDLTTAMKVIYVGWCSVYGSDVVINASSDTMKKTYAFTQRLVWEVLGQSSDAFTSPSGAESEYQTWKANVLAEIATMDSRPSFDGQSLTLDIGVTQTLTDTNDRLQYFPTVDTVYEGVEFKHTYGSNDLYITATSDCTTESMTFHSEDIGLILKYSSNSTAKVYFTDTDNQDILRCNYYPVDPYFDLNLTINLYGGLTIKKTNENGDTLGSGFTFKVWSTDTGYSETHTTNSNGIIELSDLYVGTYYIQEESVNNNKYLLDDTIYKIIVKAGEEASENIITITNTEPTGTLTITKQDIDTKGSASIDGTYDHGDANINGAVYTLYANEDIYNVAKTVKYFSKNEEIATFTFNEKGVATIKITNSSTRADLGVDGSNLTGLPMGSYYLVETKVPTGYQEDVTTYYTFTYENSSTSVIIQTGTVYEEVNKEPFEIIKISTDTNDTAVLLENVQFTAILKRYVEYYGSFEEALKHTADFQDDEWCVMTTDEKGHAISDLLAYGTYIVNETYNPYEGVNTVKEFEVTLSANSRAPTQVWKIENDTPFSSYIKLVKKDAVSGKTVTYSNATFEIYRLNETTSDWEKVQCKVGKTYYDSWTTDSEGVAYTETKLTYGIYKIVEIVVPEGFLEVNGEVTFIVSGSNETCTYDVDGDAWITVIVENEQPTGTVMINKTVELRENTDITLIKDIDYTQISFRLSANEDIIDYADGSVIYENGTVIGKYNLNSDGTLIIEELPIGSYILEEISTIDGAVLVTTKYDVVFTQEDTTTKVYNVELNIENNTTIVEISKQNIAGEEIEGATLQVIDKDGNIIDEWVSTTIPHTIEGLVEGETYILHEEIEPDGYLLAQDIEFKVSYGEDSQTITMVDEIPEVTIYKYAKTDSELFGYKAGDPVAGCQITIYDSEGNIVDVVTTGEDGSVKVSLLRGIYTFVETDLPDGFLNDSEPITLNIDGNTTSLEVVFENSAVEVELEIDKTGIIQAQPNDEIRYDFPTLINKSNVSLENFTWWEELPYEYITLTRLFTGTYNEDLDYEVYYMLVGTNEWIYYGSYNTQKNNCIDFTQIEGVVANFKICFGTVTSEFSCVTTPFIYTLVNDTVTSEDEWTNYTYLTGDYITKSGKVINLEDRAEWTVTSYEDKLEVNKLPRTGDEAEVNLTTHFIGLVLLLMLIIRKIRK